MNTPDQSSRREFLTGEAVRRAVDQALPAAEPPGTAASPFARPADYLLQIGRTAMACDFDIFLNAGQYPGATEAAQLALDLIDALESQLTVYRPTSEVMGVNRRAGQEPVVVERQLFQLLQRGVELHHQTGGAFDLTTGPLSRVWARAQLAGQFPDAETIASALNDTGTRWLLLDEATHTVQFGNRTLEFNLNAIGKGYALDRAAQLMAGHGVGDFLMHGGRSSILARGACSGQTADHPGWRVALRHPLHPERQLQEIALTNRALGTSSSSNQFFHFNGRRYGHVIDPRTGYPADRLLSATVLAPDAATADALATAFFVMGVDESVQYCRHHPEISAILVVAGRRAGEVELVTIDDRSVPRSVETDG